jgi:hypothetical protein
MLLDHLGHCGVYPRLYTMAPYFRLYSPKKAFLDLTWVLPDIKKR